MPEVQIAISELPTGFFHIFGKEKPSRLVKTVLAAVLIQQHGKVLWQSVLTTGFCHNSLPLENGNSRAKKSNIMVLLMEIIRVVSGNGKLADYWAKHKTLMWLLALPFLTS
jgi:hypothetical protein